MVQISERIQTLNESPFVTFASLASQQKDTIALNTGSPGHGCSPQVRSAIHQINAKEISIYCTPHYGSVPGRKDAAKYFQQRYGLKFDPEGHINLTIGFTHLFKCLCETILNPGNTALFIEPTFPQYEQPVILAGGKMVFIPTSEENKWKPKPEAIKAALSNNPDAKMMVFNYPNNPSGATLNETDWNQIIDVFLEELSRREQSQIDFPLVVLDEAYVPLFHRGKLSEHPTFGLTLHKRLEAATEPEALLLESLMESCLIACTLSKEGMGGVLLGMGASKNQELIKALRIARKASVIHSNLAGEIALSQIVKPDPELTIEWAGRLYETRLNRLADGLNSIFEKYDIVSSGKQPAGFIPEAGMYLYVNFSGLKDRKITAEVLSKLQSLAVGKFNFESMYVNHCLNTNLEIALWLLSEAKISVVPIGRAEDCYLRFSIALPQAIAETDSKAVDREKTEQRGQELIDKTLVQIDRALSQLN